MGSTAAITLLATADDQRFELDAITNREHADPFRAAELVGAERHQIDERGDRADVEPAHRLDGIGVQQRAGGGRANQTGHGRQVGDRADLVVDGHHADDRHLRGERVGQLIEVDPPGGVGPDDDPPELLGGMQNGVVLGGTAQGETAGTEDRRVVGLGATPREHDLAGGDAEQFGDLIARFVDRSPRIASEPVRTTRVGEPLGDRTAASPRPRQDASASSLHGRDR